MLLKLCHQEIWKNIIEYNYFWADTFLAMNKKEFEEFCDVYSEIKLPFWIETRPETVNDYNMKKLSKVGLDRISFGVEHGNEEFRKDILDRKISNQLLLDKLKIVTDMDIPISVNNIIGFPTETRELTFDTIEFNRHIRSDGINAYSFTPFHGSIAIPVDQDYSLYQPSCYFN